MRLVLEAECIEPFEISQTIGNAMKMKNVGWCDFATPPSLQSAHFSRIHANYRTRCLLAGAD